MAAYAPGTVVAGKFRVDSVVTTTATATIYAGVVIDGGQKVFLKVLLAMLAKDREDRGRFQREFDLLSKLKHGAIVTVSEMGEAEDGSPFMVMENLEGMTLRQRLERGPLDPREAMAITLQLLDAMKAVHAEGIIHRELEPGSLFVHTRPDGRTLLRIFSFAVARGANDAGKRPGAGLTQFGTVLGSAEYTSPEQAKGGPGLDGRADLYSIGCLAYAMLTGAPPFTGKQGAQVLVRQVSEAPKPPRQVRPEIPVWFEQWVLRALMKKPEERFADAGEAREALQAALKTGVMSTPAAAQPPGAAVAAPSPAAPAPAAASPVRPQPAATRPAPTPLPARPAPAPAQARPIPASVQARPAVAAASSASVPDWATGAGNVDAAARRPSTAPVVIGFIVLVAAGAAAAALFLK